MNRYNRKNEKPGSKWIGLVIVLLLTMPQLIILFLPIGIIGGIVYLIVKNQQGSSTVSRPSSRQSQVRDITYTKKRSSFDECPTGLFCFHKDKGMHHVARGKEIDPWDRPDIDISKYQRRG